MWIFHSILTVTFWSKLSNLNEDNNSQVHVTQIQVANKHLKRFSTFVVIEEVYQACKNYKRTMILGGTATYALLLECEIAQIFRRASSNVYYN
jgi:dihydrofolate reductase